MNVGTGQSQQIRNWQKENETESKSRCKKEHKTECKNQPKL